MTDFTHLHVHTWYSTLDGFCNPKELAQTVKNMGMHSVAITDHRNLYGLIDFTVACKEIGIKAIVGCEIEETEDRTVHSRKQMEELGYDNYHLVLLAMNDVGYQNMVEIVSDAATIGKFDGTERTDKSVYTDKGKGLIALSACLGGRIQQLLMKGQYDSAKEVALRFDEVFDKFYLELQYNDIPEQQLVNTLLIRMSKETGIPLVLTKDVHYILPEDADIHDTVLCIQTGKNKDDPKRFKFTGTEYYLASPEQMHDWASKNNIPIEALENTNIIANACNFVLTLNHRLLPEFEVPFGHTTETYLRQLCTEGLIRYASKKPIDFNKYLDRLEMELDVICSKGYASYFLITWDIINYARKNKIPVGPGRGSAAGCLISLLLDITRLDPIEWDFLFERFLNVDRESLPDIDSDVCYNRRNEITDYIQQRYGSDKVAQVITFTKLGVKSGLRDIMRTLGYPLKEVDILSKLVPDKMPDQSEVTLEKLLDIVNNPDTYADKFKNKFDKFVRTCREFVRALDKYPAVRKVLERAEGLVRGVSFHAAGIVITPTEITNHLPICRGTARAQLPVSQWDKDMLEMFGAIKMDILALKTLSVIDQACTWAGIDLDVLDDAKYDPFVYQNLRDGNTFGVFQLGSSGITHLLREVRPTEFNDIIDVVALYRPGPLDAHLDNGLTMVEQYIENSRNPQGVKYEHPDLETILKPTKGVMIYQEQIQKVAQKFANYSLSEADIIRRVIGKKKPADMAKLKPEFIARAVKQGYNADFADHIFEMMSAFSSYGFNRPHSGTYAELAIQTMWLKAYYPAQYMAAYISSRSKQEEIVEAIHECRCMGIPILPPDINQSLDGLNVETLPDGRKAIRMGFLCIDGIGEKVVTEILAKQPFTNLEHFYETVNKRIINKTSVSALIKSGCFDSINPDRHTVLDEYFFELREDKKSNPTLAETYSATPYDREIRLQYEFELLGMYISGHPLDHYPNTSWHIVTHRENIQITGIIKSVKKHKDKNQKDMAFVVCDTIDGDRQFVIFANVYKMAHKHLNVGKIITIVGKKDAEKNSVLVDKISLAGENNTVQEIQSAPVRKDPMLNY